MSSEEGPRVMKENQESVPLARVWSAAPHFERNPPQRCVWKKSGSKRQVGGSRLCMKGLSGSKLKDGA